MTSRSATRAREAARKRNGQFGTYSRPKGSPDLIATPADSAAEGSPMLDFEIPRQSAKGAVPAPKPEVECVRCDRGVGLKFAGSAQHLATGLCLRCTLDDVKAQQQEEWDAKKIRRLAEYEAEVLETFASHHAESA